MAEADRPEPESPRESRIGDLRIWGAAFGVVFVALVVSVILQLSRGYYDARYVDLESSTLLDTPTGSRLHLVIRHAPRHGQLDHEVRPPTQDESLYTVVVRLSAVGAPEPYESEADRREIDVDLPRVERVKVLDLRWARDEVAIIERSPPKAGT